jgi:hypothetical protein
MSGRFAPAKFDPVLILLQILCVETCYYTLLSSFLVAINQALERTFTLYQLFSPLVIDFHSSFGHYVIAVSLINSILMYAIFSFPAFILLLLLLLLYCFALKKLISHKEFCFRIGR